MLVIKSLQRLNTFLSPFCSQHCNGDRRFFHGSLLSKRFWLFLILKTRLGRKERETMTFLASQHLCKWAFCPGKTECSWFTEAQNRINKRESGLLNLKWHCMLISYDNSEANNLKSVRICALNVITCNIRQWSMAGTTYKIRTVNGLTFFI